MIKKRREFDKRSKHFFSGYHDMVKGKLVLVTLEAKGLIEKH